MLIHQPFFFVPFIVTPSNLHPLPLPSPALQQLSPPCPMCLEDQGKSLGTDNLAWPGFMLCSWILVRDDHLHGLNLDVFGWDGTHLVGDLISLHRHILPFNVWDVDKYVLPTMGRTDIAMSLRPGEVFTHALEDWSWGGPHRGWVGAGSLCG